MFWMLQIRYQGINKYFSLKYVDYIYIIYYKYISYISIYDLFITYINIYCYIYFCIYIICLFVYLPVVASGSPRCPLVYGSVTPISLSIFTWCFTFVSLQHLLCVSVHPHFLCLKELQSHCIRSSLMMSF